MAEKRKILRPKPVSGFPEYLPEVRMVEQRWLDTIRATFESYGFVNIETPSVEALEVLEAKGATDKEIYTLTRLHAEEAEEADARLGLHFDLTVPFARYAAQHFNDLDFPFKRYQMQRVWRGERPQAGRFREFTQCDVDVINVDALPLHFDAELPAVVLDALARLQVGAVTLQISNRKVLTGFLAGLGITDTGPVVRAIDKLDKIGPEAVVAELVDGVHLPIETAQRCLGLAQIRTTDTGFVDQVRALDVTGEVLDQGLEELAFVLEHLGQADPVRAGTATVVADLSIARGLDYYSGTVYEGRLDAAPGYGAITAGGRYQDLAGTYINKSLPGVGISLGLTRLFSRMVSEGALGPLRKSTADVLILLLKEEQRSEAASLARQMRARGLRVEQYHAPQKMQRQLGYAAKKGIPHVWFLGGTSSTGEEKPHEVKDMATGDQRPADPMTWLPPA